MTEKVYLDLLPIKKVDDLSVDDCLIIQGTPYSIQEFLNEQTVIVTQAGDVNADEPLQMELAIENLKEAIKAGRVKKHGRFVRKKRNV
jgi:hypothetical protein